MPDRLDNPPPEPPLRGLAQLKEEGAQQHPMIVRNVDDALRLGEIFVRSGFFDDSRAVSQAVVKVLYGVELGLSPIVAMNSIDVVEGKCAPGAQLTASKIETHPLYDYVVEERTAEVCTIAFYRRQDRRPDGELQLRGRVTWDTATARRAGLLPAKPGSGWTKYPQAMLYARAITEGARAYCPDLFHGIAAYSAEELGGAGDPVEPFNLSPTPPPPPTEPVPPTVGDPVPDDGSAAEGEVVDAPEEPAEAEEQESPQEPATVQEAQEPAEEPAAPVAPAEAAQTADPAPVAEEPAATAPTWQLDATTVNELVPPEEGTKEAGRANARELGLRTRLGGDAELVACLEAIGAPGAWALCDDRVSEAAKVWTAHRVAEREREAVMAGAA